VPGRENTRVRVVALGMSYSAIGCMFDLND
jgi:hypothetical protein